MPRTTRTFIALPVPKPLKAKLERLQRLIAPDLPGARWVEPEAFHLTLAFLGDVDDTDLNPLCKAVAAAAAGHGPVGLVLKGLGAFPDPASPRVLWAGIEGDLDPLGAIQRAVFAAAAGAGYRPDDDRFHPHITLGRLKVGREAAPDASALVAHYRNWIAGHYNADTVVTYTSSRTPEGVLYAPLGLAPLANRNDA